MAEQPDLVAILHHLQEQNQQMQAEIDALQAAAVGSSDHPSSTSTEPKVQLPEKFDGSRSKYQGFLNQVRLVFDIQPRRYRNDRQKVGLIGTLLTGSALKWFSPLLEIGDAMLTNLPAFLREFEAVFGETDHAHVATSKLRRLSQGSRPTSVYTSKFCLLAGDTNWNEAALIDQMQRNLRQEV